MMHMRFYWGFDMTLWSWEVCGPIGYAASLAAIVLLALAHESLAAHRAAVAKACACGPGCGGAGAAKQLRPTRLPAASAPSPAAPTPVPAPCCCGPAPGTSTGSAMTAPLLVADEETGRPGGGRPQPGGQPASTTTGPGALDTAAYALHAATSYLLMLAVMTFNLGACGAVLGGLAAGHAAFAGRGASLGDACCAPAGGALEAAATAQAAAAQAAAAAAGSEWDGPPGMAP